MKKKIFYFIWATICAWLFTKLLLWMDARFELTHIAVINGIVNLIHGWNVSVRKIVFGALLLVFLISGIQKIFGHWILSILGIAAILVVVTFVLMICWYFLSWIISTL